MTSSEDHSLARGQHAQAIADLRQCGELLDRARLHNPNFWAWRSALALESEQAAEARELAQAELGLARRAGSSRAMGIALRVFGLLAGGNEGIELLEQSVAVLEPDADAPGVVWVPNWSSASCDLGVFVYQPVEPIAMSQVTLGRGCRRW